MKLDDKLIQKLNNYKMSDSAADVIRSAKIVFLVGITAAGKDTVINELMKSGDYHYIISHTTRAPRYNLGVLEHDGIDYHFIDLKRVEEMLDKKEFIEAKLVHGNIYGTGVKEIQDAKDKSEIAISEIEVQGIAEYRAISDTVLPIFLLPPNFKTWQERMIKRYGESVDKEDFRKRMETAKDELQEALDKDYFEFVINEDLTTTVLVVNQIAHGHLSAKKNEQAKEIARNLLTDLNEAL